MNLFDAIVDETARSNGTPRPRTQPEVSDGRKGKPLAEIIGTVQAEGRTRTDAIVDTRNIDADVCLHLDGEVCLTVRADIDGLADKPLPLTRHAHGQVAGFTGIPWKYYQRMKEDQPGLLVDNVAAWFKAEPSRRLIRTVGTRGIPEGGMEAEIRAMLSDRYLCLDHPRFLATVLEEAGRLGAKPHRANIDPDRLHVELLTERTAEVPGRLGDVIRQGITIRNSEVGDGSLQVEPWMLRLICWNGMTSRTKYRRTHLGQRNDTGVLSRETLERQAEAVWSEVRDWVRLALDPERMEELTEVMGLAAKTDAPTDAVLVAANLADTLALTQLEAYKVFDAYRQEEDFTQYGVMNAVTRAAQTIDSFDRAKALEDAGSALLFKDGTKLARQLGREVADKRVESALGATVATLRA